MRAAGRDMDRLIVVSPGDQRSYLESVFMNAGRTVPSALTDWEEHIDAWCDEYLAAFGPCAVVEVEMPSSVYFFDRTFERVVIAYGLAVPPSKDRDSARMRRFPDVNVGIQSNLGDRAFTADRGHFLSHGAGGELDINLFPHRRELNRGWSSEGKVFRRMEAYVASRPGTFHAHRPTYDDETWIPAVLEYQVLVEDSRWWVGTFANK